MKPLRFVFAIMVIAAAAVLPAAAADFSAGGSYRALAISEDPGGNTPTSHYFDQRLRLALKWDINDNVKAQLRGDFAEFTWGDDYRPDQGSDTLMVDRAFVTIKQGPLTLKVGQQAGEWGLGTLWSDQFQGIQADIALSPFTLKLLYSKESEGGVTGDTITDNNPNDDDDIYGASVLYATDAFSGGLSYAMLKSRSDSAGLARDFTTNGYAAHIIAPMGSNMTVSAEGAVFSGDDGAATDYKGTQFHAALDVALTETIKGGVTVLWADGVDAKETQITSIQDDGVFAALDFAGALGADNGNYGNNTGIFDVSGNGKGALGIVGDIQFAATEELTFYAKLGYAEPNDNDNLDSNLYAIGNVDYAWMPAVMLSGGVGYVVPDYADNTNDDPVVEFIFRLGVSF
ncbi:porin [Desulfobacula sp.]|uniref:porin n=1 Tax=Desulfobacula sp. TaxID=2593537 RepID=UPI0026300570|nr:porin [Desulfobacula sp.]